MQEGPKQYSPNTLSKDEMKEIEATPTEFAREYLEYWIGVFHRDVQQAKRNSEDYEDGLDHDYSGYKRWDEEVGDESSHLLNEFQEYLDQLNRGTIDSRKLIEFAKKGYLLVNYGNDIE